MGEFQFALNMISVSVASSVRFEKGWPASSGSVDCNSERVTRRPAPTENWSPNNWLSVNATDCSSYSSRSIVSSAK